MGTHLEPLSRAMYALQARYATDAALAMDPLAVARAYADPADKEVASWIAAHLAYGRVTPMLRAIRAVLEPLGNAPAQWLRSLPPDEIRRRLTVCYSDWVWRFQTGEDMARWLALWAELDRGSGHQGLESYLLPDKASSSTTHLSRFVLHLRGRLPHTTGLRFFLPDPASGSACKRWRMFLRWVVRTEWPDLGLWKRYPKAGLIIPVDTHVARFATLLGLTDRKTPDAKMAEQITARLAEIDPQDPLRFDFALAHLGILGDCSARGASRPCDTCPLCEVCGSAFGQRADTSY